MSYLIDPRALMRFADQSAAIYLRSERPGPSDWTRGYVDAMETIRIYAEAMDAPEVGDVDATDELEAALRERAA